MIAHAVEYGRVGSVERWGDHEWVLLHGPRGLCNPESMAELDTASVPFDFAASCGITRDCGGEPLSAGDDGLRGTRAFADAKRVTVAFWLPASAHESWFALTGGALLARAIRLKEIVTEMGDLPESMDLAVLAITRKAAMGGARCAVLPELLAVEDLVPEVRSLGAAFPARTDSVRLARGLRGSFREDEAKFAVRWAHSLMSSCHDASKETGRNPPSRPLADADSLANAR
jgi:hypothetical protein